MNRAFRRSSVVAAVAVCSCVPTAGWAMADTASSPVSTKPSLSSIVAPSLTTLPTSTSTAPRITSHNIKPAAAPALPYYGNPKVGVQVSPNPGQFPTFADDSIDYPGAPAGQSPDLSDFTIQGAADGTVNGACTTAGPQPNYHPTMSTADGACDMDPNGTDAFPVTDAAGDPFDFSISQVPLGWVEDPDGPQTMTTTVTPCGDTPGEDDCSLDTLGGTSVPYFNVIGIFRTVQVQVDSAVTGEPLGSGITVHLTCTVPAGEPADVCSSTSEDAITNGSGLATFTGLFAPTAPITVATTTGLAGPYQNASLDTTVPSPVTADTTTGAEISAAAMVPATLTLTPAAPLATVPETTPEDTTLSITGLATDTPGLNGLTLSGVGQPAHGTATLNADGSVTYVPTTGYVGPDSFTYSAAAMLQPDTAPSVVRAQAALAGVYTGTVNVTVTPVAPTAGNTTATTPEGDPVGVALTPLVAGPAGNTVSVTGVSTPGHGTVALVNGTATYTPAAGFTGTDTFTYTATAASPNNLTASGTVTVTVTAATGPTTTSTTTSTTTTPPTTTPSTTPPTTTPTPTATIAVAAAPTTSSGGLAFTGSDVIASTASGTLLIGIGASLTKLSRRRYRRRH